MSVAAAARCDGALRLALRRNLGLLDLGLGELFATIGQLNCAHGRHSTRSRAFSKPDLRSKTLRPRRMDCGSLKPALRTTAMGRYCSLMGQGREALLRVDALGMPVFSACSFGA
jgi:hypothetical protein